MPSYRVDFETNATFRSFYIVEAENAEEAKKVSLVRRTADVMGGTSIHLTGQPTYVKVSKVPLSRLSRWGDEYEDDSDDDDYMEEDFLDDAVPDDRDF